MKGLEEIDCNEDIWDECVYGMGNGRGPFAQELRFAFQSKSTKISEDDLVSKLWEVYPNADQVEVERVKPESREKGMKYFAASVIIWESGI